MKNIVNKADVTKKMHYSKPKTDILEVRMENLMLSVSTNSGGGGGGVMHAPARNGENIPY